VVRILMGIYALVKI